MKLSSFLLSIMVVVSILSCSSDIAPLPEDNNPTVESVDPCFDAIANINTTLDYIKIELPDGTTFTGLGTDPMDIKLNGEDFTFSAILSDTNLDDKEDRVQAVYHLYNANKHQIWGAAFVNRNAPSYNENKVIIDDSLDILGGTGEYKCMNGMIVVQGHLDMIGKSSILSLTLSMCESC